jgi:hypothetical protein
MKPELSNLSKLMLPCLLLTLFSCPGPDPGPGPVVSDPWVLDIPQPGLEPYMVVAENKIYTASASREYSVNDKAGWTDCNGGIVGVTFSTGNKVWVREKLVPATEWYLGEVKSTGSYADLYPSSRVAACKWDTTYNK